MFGNDVLCPTRVVDHRFDLASVTDDSFVLQQSLDVRCVEARDPFEIEVTKGGAKVFAFRENGPPAEAGLEALQAQLFE